MRSTFGAHPGGETIRGAIDGRGSHDLKLLAFTALSSFDASDLKDIYNWPGTVEEFMVDRARVAKQKGVDGVKLLRCEMQSAATFLIVTPGVRLNGGETHDHKRTLGPREAIEAGSDYLVVGRLIAGAADHAARPTSSSRRWRRRSDKESPQSKGKGPDSQHSSAAVGDDRLLPVRPAVAIHAPHLGHRRRRGSPQNRHSEGAGSRSGSPNCAI
jgi:hypothetical protein